MKSQTTVNFVQNIIASWSNNNALLTKPKPKDTQPNMGFIIRHFVGDVLYNAVSVTTLFIKK